MHVRDAHVAIVRRPHVRAIGHANRAYEVFRRYNGLYQGIPLPERTWEHGNALPDCITLFQRPIEADHEAEDEIRAAIGETLIHEVGHYFGLSEEEIEEIEERYWRGDTLGADEDDT